MINTDSKKLKELLKIYFIMGSVNCQKDPVEVLEEAIAGGITLFQFREKGPDALTGNEKLELAQKLRTLCEANDVPFIVNDDIDLALAVDADGVHIGQEDEPVEVVRRKIGNKVIGVSVHTLEEAARAFRNGADYFGVGPIFPTSTKKDTKPVQGVSFLQKLRECDYTLPIVGIGGITDDNASIVTKAGGDGVSIITAITNADDIPSQVRKLAEAVLAGLENR
jgi:thiamine-phosphate pyrophosphorylase